MSQGAATLEWLQKFHEAGDSLDTAAWSQFFAEDVTVHMGNNPPVQGREVFMGAASRQTGLLESMKHIITHFDVVGDRIYHQTLIEYKIKGDSTNQTITVSAIAIVHRNLEGKVTKLEIYVDNTPLMAKVKEVMAAKAAAQAAPTPVAA